MKRTNRLNIFSRRKQDAVLLDAAPALEEFSESSESSLEPSVPKEAIANHIGELNASMKHKKSSTLLNSSNSKNSDGSIMANRGSNDDRINETILRYKGRRSPLSDTPTPRRPYRCNSFKMDGVPAFMSKEIERKARKDAEKKRLKRQRAKSKAASDELHESISSLYRYEEMPHMTIQCKQTKRPKVSFLDLPMGHPLHWDQSQFPASDFPEKDRAFLVRLFKHQQSVVRGRRLPTRVELTLRKMQLFDWDAATIGRCATMLFDPETNSLNLDPSTNQYFFERFDSLRTKLLEGSEVVYRGETYNQGGASDDLFERLRRDFENATRGNKANHDEGLPF